MRNWLNALGMFLMLAGVTALVIGLFRYFFPVVEDYIPNDFKRPLSISYAGYYILAGLALLSF